MGRINKTGAKYIVIRPDTGQRSFLRQTPEALRPYVCGQVSVPWLSKIINYKAPKTIKISLHTDEDVEALRRRDAISVQVDELYRDAKDRLNARQRLEMAQRVHALSFGNIHQMGDQLRHDIVDRGDRVRFGESGSNEGLDAKSADGEPARPHERDTTEERRRAGTPDDDLSDAINRFRTTLPGWWYQISSSSIGSGATIGPERKGPDSDLLARRRFEEGISVDLPNATIAEALDQVVAAALRAKAQPGDEEDKEPPARAQRTYRFAYRNHRDTVADRTVRVMGMRFGTSPYHPTPGPLLLAFDVERNAVREFSTRAMGPVGTTPLDGRLVETLLADALRDFESDGDRQIDDDHWSRAAREVLEGRAPTRLRGEPDMHPSFRVVRWPTSAAAAPWTDLGPTPEEDVALIVPYAEFDGGRATNAFDLLQRSTWQRTDTTIGLDPLFAWAPVDWSNALGGEVGEFQNVIKKMKRNVQDGRNAERINAAMLELADVVIYAHLAASRLGRRLWPAVAYKFNSVSLALGSTILMPYDRVERIERVETTASQTKGA